MLIKCSLTIQDLNHPHLNSRPLKSCVMTRKSNNNYYVSVKNSMYPNIKNYNLAMVKNIFRRFITEGKLGLEFTEPKHVLLIDSEQKSEVIMFHAQIKAILDGKKVNIGSRLMPKAVSTKKAVINRFDPKALKFVAENRFDNRVLNMRHLTTLVLEKCDLPTIPVEIGHLPITYLSISGSKLATNQDTFWNWTSITTICDTLLVLKMDSLGLKRLPFEIMFLRNLQELSISHNYLSYLPQFIGELKKLKSIFVNDNSLVYLPHCLSSRVFNSIDISDNLFNTPRTQPYDHLLQYLSVFEIEIEDFDHVKPLSHFALFSLMDNCVPFKRQDLPRTLWIYFNLLGRCVFCMRWILPDYSQISLTHFLPRAIELIKDQGTTSIPWQSMLCSIPNICTRQI
ncbi:uncharacterized protein LOC112596654 [Melanaphis sacchari]|uniref:uncharacterized protein LOC112596654 n=1 Tax=Melanaphis sacchari TaxID=742174 RepID=UPI000DC14998|nr:uncharacterized protein LOC112596654 [Melanaphis sacchari]